MCINQAESNQSNHTLTTQVSHESLSAIVKNDDSTNNNEIPEIPYSIFTRTEKLVIVLTVSISGFFSAFSSNIYYPAVNLIEDDLHITETMVNLTITMYMIFKGVSPSFWGSLADNIGRRPVYIVTFFIYLGSCIGLACTNNYAGLLILRMLQAVGSSSATALCVGTIGDISLPSERGGNIGISSMGSTVGSLIGPSLGGAISYALGWRWIFWVLAIIVAPIWLIQVFWLPETLRSLVGNGSGYANPTPLQFWRNEETKTSIKRKGCIAFPNPFQSFTVLKEKDVAILLFYNACQYAGIYCIITSMTGLLVDNYGLNSFQVGMCFLPNGIAGIIGSYLSGKTLDWQFKKTSKALGTYEKYMQGHKIDLDFPIEQVRMGTTWISGVIFSASMIAYGWCFQYKVHLAIPIVLTFILSASCSLTFNGTSTLLVDLFPDNSATISASNNLTKCLLGATSILLVQPGIDSIGVGWFFTAASLFLLSTKPILSLELKYGPTWRAERQKREDQKTVI
ncbi:major facilitator superfamily domain-containing protein [Pilaira anomala]|nr:major facilitator superfamily domain-containing protein [Pilaira anomala]